MRGGFLYCLLSTRELSLNRERRGPFTVCSPSYLNYQHIKMGVASLSREAGPFAVCSLSYLNYQHIRMGAASLSQEAGPFAAYPEIGGTFLINIHHI